MLVSHSARLAERLRDLLEQVAQGRVPIALAAGAAGGPAGTDALAIGEAIGSLAGPDGVIVRRSSRGWPRFRSRVEVVNVTGGGGRTADARSLLRVVGESRRPRFPRPICPTPG